MPNVKSRRPCPVDGCDFVVRNIIGKFKCVELVEAHVREKHPILPPETCRWKCPVGTCGVQLVYESMRDLQYHLTRHLEDRHHDWIDPLRCSKCYGRERGEMLKLTAKTRNRIGFTSMKGSSNDKPQIYTPFQGSKDSHPRDSTISKIKASQQEGTGHKTRDLVSIEPEWWLKKIKSIWSGGYEVSEERYLLRRFGENWWTNPYFIAWGAQTTYTWDNPIVVNQITQLLDDDYKSHECDVDDDIKIIYGPILEKIKNGTSLEKAVVEAPLFGIVTEEWQAWLKDPGVS